MIFISPYIKKIAAFSMGCFFLCSCENSIKDIKALDEKAKGVEIAKEVNIKYSVGGHQKADLYGPIMYRVQDTVPYVEFPKTIHVDFYDDKENKESILDAKYAKYIETQSKILLRDSVRFIGLKNGDTLYCNELYWDRNRPVYQFYTDKPVQIRTKTQIIDGIGFETSQDFKEKLIKQVTNSILKVPTSEFPD
ncbi:MAG: LPS export ABC transporter periplasmic protein LptC [Ferruginibacter sp.]